MGDYKVHDIFTCAITKIVIDENGRRHYFMYSQEIPEEVLDVMWKESTIAKGDLNECKRDV